VRLTTTNCRPSRLDSPTTNARASTSVVAPACVGLTMVTVRLG
jgi:hypothetical protein